MRRPEHRARRFALLAGLVAWSLAGSAHAKDAAPAASTAAAQEAPPLTEAEESEEMPEGHPAVGGANPHAHAGHGNGMAGVFDPPPDTEKEDPTLAPGTIAVELRDADDHPVPGEMVTLGALINSVAKGDSRKHVQATTDAEGKAVFSGQDTASNIAYRVSSGYQGGLFAAMPFQLGQAKSMRVVLHVYPVVHDISGALIVCEAAVAAELRDDRIQVEEALTVYNLGRTAWQPDDVRMALPAGFQAFNAQASMSDQGVDQAGDSGKLRGTFGPGRNAVQFRWQLPWSGDKDVDFEVGMPPHVAIARVMMPATSNVKLEATGFPPPEVRHDDQGQSFLVTERKMRPDDPKLTSLALGIHDLPVPGPGRTVASLLAACGVAIGIVFATAGRGGGKGAPKGDKKRRRSALLAELAELERARASGDVGPRTYEKARRDLIDGIARTLGSDASS